MIIININYGLLGKRISQKRRELGLKQNELAEKADLSNNYLSNIENARSIPSIKALASICGSLNTTPDYVLLGTMKSYAIPENIMDNLKLCSDDSIELISDFVQLVLHRQISK